MASPESDAVFIFGDESGTLVDPYDPVVVVALIVTTRPESLKSIISRAWRKYTARKGKRRPISEFKFHRVEEIDRQQVLSALSRTQIELAVLVVEKGDQQIPDTTENYGLLVTEAVEMCQSFYPATQMVITLDRHFSKPAAQQAVSNALMARLALTSRPTYADSQTSPMVQLADFVAGAFHRKQIRGDNSLASLVAERVIEQRILSWKDLRRKWLSRRGTENGKSPGGSL